MKYFLALFALILLSHVSAQVCEVQISNLDPTMCDDQNQYDLFVNLEYNDLASDSFDLQIDGELYDTYAYANLPILLPSLTGDCETTYILQVFDSEVDGCFSENYDVTVCCPGTFCDLGPLDYDISNCNVEEEVNITFDFDYNDLVSDSFNVVGNGNDYGTYAYSELPVTIGPIDADCSTEYELGIIDSDDNGCVTGTEIGTICCGDCSIGDLFWESTDCNDDGNVFVIVAFEYENVSDSFEIVGNGNDYGTFAYTDIPLTFGPFEGDCETNYEMVVKDIDFPDCQSVAEIGSFCCTNNCEIGEISWEATDCNDDDEVFVFVNFDYASVSDSFELLGDGNNYGTFAYSELPVNIGPFEANCETLYELIAKDLDSPDCTSDVTLGEFCCTSNCEMGELTIDYSDCNDNGNYFIVFDFDYANVSDSFVLEFNGIAIDIYSYSELPVTLEGIEGNCDFTNSLLVYDLEFDGCASDAAVFQCCDEEACNLGELSYEISDCNDADQVFITIDLEYVNTSDSFEVVGNGNNYGNFAYSQLPIEIGPIDANCDTNYEIGIHDLEFDDCTVGTEIGVLCCSDDCFIGELFTEVTDCNDDDQVFVVVNFEYINVSDSFELVGNGNNYGTFAYTALPVTIGPFEANCETVYELIAKDLDSPDCVSDIALGEFCCEDECFIGELAVDYSECNDDGLYFITFNFEYANVSDSFEVIFAGENIGTYAYSELPLTIEGIEGNCEEAYGLLVKDHEFGDCASDIGILNCCENEDCFIGELNVEYSECSEDDFYFITFNFEYANVSDSFEVIFAGENIGTYSYSALPITIEGIEGNCEEEYGLLVKDHEIEGCAVDVSILNCCENECTIGELNVEITDCNDDGEFFFVLDFEYNTNAFSFSVIGNGTDYGDFEYGSLPVEIGPLPGDCETEYELVVIDNDDEDCSSAAEIGTVCCDEECNIGEIELESVICDDGYVDITLDFSYSNNSDVYYVFIEDEIYGYFPYEDLPLTINDYQHSDDTVTIEICDASEACCETIDVFVPCPTSTSEVIEENVIFYQNNQEIIFQSKIECEISIYDILGREYLNNSKLQTSQTTIDVGSWNSGVYIVTFEIDGALHSEKIVITK